MEREASNTLRTLGIVLTAIFMIAACGILLLFSFCVGLLSSGSHDNQGFTWAMVALAVAGVVAVIGGLVIAKLSRGLVHEQLAVSASSSVAQAAEPGVAPTVHFPAPSPVVRFDAAHFSPASRAAVRQLILAVGGYIVFTLLTVLLPMAIPRSLLMYPLAGAQTAGMLTYMLAYRLVAIVPYAVLLYSLSKYPGPRAFAYSLVVPVIALLGSVFSIPLMLFTLSRMSGHFLVSLLSSLALAVPAVLNFGIAYFGWVAIQKTGIHPPPKRLVIASLVIFFYNSMSGVLGGILLGVFGQRLLRP